MLFRSSAFRERASLQRKPYDDPSDDNPINLASHVTYELGGETKLAKFSNIGAAKTVASSLPFFCFFLCSCCSLLWLTFCFLFNFLSV